MMPQYAVILLAAGRSSRFRDREKKPYATLDGRALWLRSLELFAVRDDVAQIVIVIAPEDREVFFRRYQANVAFLTNTKVVDGGAERADSVQNALAVCVPTADLIAVHDTARPCLTAALVDAVFQRAAETGAAALACPVVDTLKRVDPSLNIVETVSREGLWQIQTPQVFRRQLLLDAYAHRGKLAESATDDARLVEAIGHPVAIVESDASNLKVTSKRDLALAEAILKSRPKPKDPLGMHPFGDEQMWK